MILMRTAGSSIGGKGQVLYYYGGSNVKLWPFEPGDSLTAMTTLLSRPTAANLFCSGHSHLPDGTLLVTGGTETSRGGEDDTGIFNPLTRSWQSLPLPASMNQNRWYPTNTSLADGRVLTTSGDRFRELVTFGGRDSISSNSVHNTLHAVLGLRLQPVVNPDTTVNDTLPPARSGHSAIFANISGGQSAFTIQERMVVFGGRGSADNALSDVWGLTRDEFSVWKWNRLNPDAPSGKPKGRSGHSATYDDSLKTMLVFGGLDTNGVGLRDIWKLKLKNGSVRDEWVKVSVVSGNTIPALRGHSAIFQRKGNGTNRILVFGGYDGTTYYNKVWELKVTPTQDSTWTEVTTSGGPPAARSGHVGVYDYISKRMVVFGGRDGSGPRNDLWVLTLPLSGTPTWSEINDTNPPVPRMEAAGIFDPEWPAIGTSGRLVIVGGDSTTTAPGGEKGDVWYVPLNTGPFTWERTHGNLPGGARAGLSAIFDVRWQRATRPEIFTAGGGGAWSLMSSTATKFQSLYPNMFLLPLSGRVIEVAPTFQTPILNTATATWETPTWALNSKFAGGTSVMYRPGKVMKCGNEGPPGLKTTGTVDLSSSETSALWDTLGVSGLLGRCRHNLTILPNGKVLATGGLLKESLPYIAQKRPQVWNPTSGVWELSDPPLADDPAIRDYHSTALLLPDGRILSAGGGFSDISNPHRRHATIFWPPYLFDSSGNLAARPTITGLDTTIAYGEVFGICSGDTTNITKVVLMKPGAVTHQFNQEQRYIELQFTSSLWGTTRRLQVKGPPNGNYAPPGDYMLFLMKWNSVPSLAAWVRISPTATCKTAPCYARTGNIPAGGEIWTKSNGPHFINGELTVPVSTTLTIQDSTQVYVHGTSSKLTVRGSLVVLGAAMKKVRFTSAGCAPQEGDWWGIDVKPGGVAKVVHADIKYGYYGVRSERADSLRIDSSTFASNQGRDIRVTGNPTLTTVFPVAVRWNTVTVGSSGGIEIDSASVAGSSGGTILGNIVTGTSASTFGIAFMENMGVNGAPAVTSNVVSGFTTWRGCWVKSGKPVLTLNDFKDSKYGVEVVGGGPQIGTTSSTSDNLIHGNTGGVYVACAATGCPSTCTAVPLIRNNQIYSNGSGVRIDGVKNPIGFTLGDDAVGDPGNNSIYSNTAYCIRYTQSCGTLKAEGNWFGNQDCDGLMTCTSGSVDTNPYLCFQPASSRHTGIEPVPEAPASDLRIQALWPNPATSETSVRLELVEGSGEVVIWVFDVTGRLLREFDLGRLDSGVHEVIWDGRDSRGVEVGSGIYFLRVLLNEAVTRTAKVLISR